MNESTVASHTDLVRTVAGTKSGSGAQACTAGHIFPLRAARAQIMCKSVTRDPQGRCSSFFCRADRSSTAWNLETHGFHYWWKTPFRAEESFAVEASLPVDVSVQNVHTDHAGVHRVGVLLHSSLGHRFPRMAVDATQKILEMIFTEMTAAPFVSSLYNILAITIC